MKVQLASGGSGKIIGSVFLQLPTDIVDEKKIIVVEEVYSLDEGLSPIIIKGEAVLQIDNSPSVLVIYLKELNCEEIYHEIELSFEVTSYTGLSILPNYGQISDYGNRIEKKILKVLRYITENLAKKEVESAAKKYRTNSTNKTGEII